MPIREILVHVSGPSTSKDDERYRKMAKAYEEFEARQKITVGSVVLLPGDVQDDPATIPFDVEYYHRLQNPHLEANTTLNRQVGRELLDEEGEVNDVSAVPFVENTQAAGAYLESQLFTSSLQALSSPPSSEYSHPDILNQASSVAHNASSPPATTGIQPILTLGAYSSSLDLSTFVPTPLAPRMVSLSTTTPGVLTTRPEALLKTPIALPSAKVPPSVEILTRTPTLKRKRGFAESEPRRVRTPKTFLNAEIATSSTLSASSTIQPAPAPSSYASTAPIERRSLHEGRFALSNALAPVAPPVVSSLSVAERVPNVPNTVREVPTSTMTPIRLSRLQEILPPPPESNNGVTRTVRSNTTALPEASVPVSPPVERSAVYEVLPPPPPTLLAAAWISLSTKHTYITTSLQELDNTLSLSKRFKPAVMTRTIRQSERGCWMVDTSIWDVKLQHEFWDELSGFVADGRAGWGVTCFRDEVADTIGLVQVYCWGEVVGHVYLLIFLASKSKIKRTGARWIDAGGTMVVKMDMRPTG